MGWIGDGAYDHGSSVANVLADGKRAGRSPPAIDVKRSTNCCGTTGFRDLQRSLSDELLLNAISEMRAGDRAARAAPRRPSGCWSRCSRRAGRGFARAAARRRSRRRWARSRRVPTPPRRSTGGSGRNAQDSRDRQEHGKADRAVPRRTASGCCSATRSSSTGGVTRRRPAEATPHRLAPPRTPSSSRTTKPAATPSRSPTMFCRRIRRPAIRSRQRYVTCRSMRALGRRGGQGCGELSPPPGPAIA